MKNAVVVFEIDEQRYGMRLSSIDSVIRAVEITPITDAPKLVIGIINVRGIIYPVINVRKRFQLPEKEIDINHCIVLARTSIRKVALFVDKVDGIIEISEEKIINSENIVPDLGYVEGIAKLEDGMILIYNLDIFL
jgi:purine-binding chemotaxis protein CheW